MEFNQDEKDLIFLSLNSIIKDYEKWNNLEIKDKYHFLNVYKKVSKNDNSQFNISYKLSEILNEYNENFIYDEVFLSKASYSLLYGIEKWIKKLKKKFTQNYLIHK